LHGLFRLALDNCRRAYSSWARGRGRALCRGWALNYWASRARAGRALTRITTFTLALAIIHDYRLGLGDAALQDILA